MLNYKVLCAIADMLYAAADAIKAAENLPNLEKAEINKETRQDAFNAINAINSALKARPDAEA